MVNTVWASCTVRLAWVYTGLYLISRSGAELLLKQFENKAPGTVADDYKLYQQWGVDVRFVQPGLCDWEGSSVILIR